MRALFLICCAALAGTACGGGRGTGGGQDAGGQSSTDANVARDASSDGDGAPTVDPRRVHLALGPDLPTAVGTRVRELLESVPALEVHDVAQGVSLAELEGTLIALGDHALA